ncbi:MAG: DUF4434 domain-containing protein [Bacillota bacterium]
MQLSLRSLLVCLFIFCFLISTAFASVTSTPKRLKVVPTSLNMLAGSFFQIYLVNGWQRQTFDEKFHELKQRGMDHVIWQWTADSFHKKTYYPTTMSGWENEVGYDAVGVSLASAKANGLKVWLGLNWTDDWWNHYGNDKPWLQNEFAISQNVCNELWNKYKLDYNDTIAGFYITMEVDNVNYDSPSQQQNMIDVYATLTNYIHTTTHKPVMVAPFFNESCGMTPTGFADFWGNILKTAPIDIVAMQDGVGVHHVKTTTVGEWYKKMRDKINSVRPTTELWSDLETFDEVNDEFNPASNVRILEQIQAERPYVKKFTTFAWLHYNM